MDHQAKLLELLCLNLVSQALDLSPPSLNDNSSKILQIMKQTLHVFSFLVPCICLQFLFLRLWLEFLNLTNRKDFFRHHLFLLWVAWLLLCYWCEVPCTVNLTIWIHRQISFSSTGNGSFNSKGFLMGSSLWLFPLWLHAFLCSFDLFEGSWTCSWANGALTSVKNVLFRWFLNALHNRDVFLRSSKRLLVKLWFLCLLLETWYIDKRGFWRSSLKLNSHSSGVFIVEVLNCLVSIERYFLGSTLLFMRSPLAFDVLIWHTLRSFLFVDFVFLFEHLVKSFEVLFTFIW